MYRYKTMKCDDENLMKQVVENFLSDKPKKKVFGNFRITDDGLYYEAQTQSELNADRKDREKWQALIRRVKQGEVKLVDETLDDLKAWLDSKDEHLNWHRAHYTEIETDVIALKIKQKDAPDLILGNSAILSLIGRTVSYGNVRENRDETVIQRILSTKIRMIPFNVFDQAGLNLNSIKILDQSGPEELWRQRPNPNFRSYHKEGPSNRRTFSEKVHFTGASLFSVQGKYFLFDVDRRETKHKIFNPFLAEIPVKVSTIKEAYEALKPKAVKAALKAGKKVERQGEWFFIPVKAPKLPRITDELILKALAQSAFSRLMEPLESMVGKQRVKAVIAKAQKDADQIPKALSLKAGNNRPNNAQLGVQQGRQTLVTGKISHTGREHADLILKGWYLAIPNTATRSVTVTGDID